jgi:hypothetical protein
MASIGKIKALITRYNVKQPLTPFTLEEALDEVLARDGELVFEHRWDSGGPGAGADIELVYKWQSVYWAKNSDTGLLGPCRRLSDCFCDNDYLVGIGDATTGVRCAEMSRSQLRRFLQVVLEESPHDFELNSAHARAHFFTIVGNTASACLERQNIVRKSSQNTLDGQSQSGELISANDAAAVAAMLERGRTPIRL